MRILFLVTGMTMGGAERMVCDLADRLPGDVLIAYLKGPVEVRPKRPGVRMASLDMHSPRDLLPGYFRLRRLVREFKPDIIHAHMYHAAMLARLLRLSLPAPCIITTMHTSYCGGRAREIALRLTDPLTDISTNVSREAVEAFVACGAVPAARVVTVHNGIAVDKFRPIPAAREALRRQFGIEPGCRLLVAAGRLGWSKDYPNMFAALAQLERVVDFRLLIAGDGPLRSELEQAVEQRGLSQRVRFLGLRDDIPELMAGADVFVLSSVGEAFGLVVAEAMACACVVVATDSGGVREVLGDAGFLVPKSDPDALAAALQAACALSDQEAAALRKAARQRVVELYSLEQMVVSWMSLYGDVLGQRRRGRRSAGLPRTSPPHGSRHE